MLQYADQNKLDVCNEDFSLEGIIGNLTYNSIDKDDLSSQLDILN